MRRPLPAHGGALMSDESAPSPRPLRIAVIGGRGVPSTYSGVEKICEELFAWFAARGHKITVYCRPQVLAGKTGEYKGIRLVRTAAPGGKNGETLSHSLTSLLHAATRGDIHDGGIPFDLISMHTIAPNLFSPIATLAGIPVISHVHGLDHLREKWKGMGSRIIALAEQVMVRTSKKVAGVNPAIQAYYRDRFKLETELLPNGVHITPDRPADPTLLQQFKLQPGRYFVSVGRVVPEKRLHDTIARLSVRTAAAGRRRFAHRVHRIAIGRHARIAFPRGLRPHQRERIGRQPIERARMP